VHSSHSASSEHHSCQSERPAEGVLVGSTSGPWCINIRKMNERMGVEDEDERMCTSYILGSSYLDN